MNKGLLIIQRIVIESLVKKDKNILELENDTGLGQGLLKNILQIFLMNNLIAYRKGTYVLNEGICVNSLKELNSVTNVKEEIKEIFLSMVNQYFSDNKKEVDIKVKKIWLTPSEKRLFNSYFINMENFIKNIEAERKLKPQNEKLCEKDIFIWGHSNYSSLVQGSMQTV